jgi:hypothetical protein
MKSTERGYLLESYICGYDKLKETLSKMPESMWQYKPGPEEWSIHEILVHLADSEANLYVRARRFIAEPGSKVLSFDNDLWAKKLDYHKQSAEASLRLFRYLRELTYELLREQPESVWGNTVEHSEFGVMTLDQWLERAVKHVDDHVKQIKEVFEAWSKQEKVKG